MEDLAVFCADVGSIKRKQFGWATYIPGKDQQAQGTDIVQFAELISEALGRGYRVALGFECPLFVPVRSDPVLVNSARRGEGNRPWSAGAGTGALATGLVEALWVLNKVAELQELCPKATVDWSDFKQSDNSILLWEAFVTSSSKGAGHVEDASIAVNSFRSSLPDIGSASAIEEDNVLSLVGAAALRAGWSSDLSLLAAPCIVIKA